MASKVQTYTELAVRRTAAVTGSYEEWSAFLAVAARVYKYPFLEQLMIYVQRPQATACAEYQVWTRRMRRYVRRGTQGIALVYIQGGRPAVRYVFDVADTAPLANALSPKLWQYREEHQPAVSAALTEAFQTPGDGGLPVQAAYIAARLADSAWQRHRDTLLRHTQGGCLSGYSEGSLRLAFQDAASASVTYMVLSRCGLQPERFFDAADFAHVYEFNAYPAVLILGTAVSDAAGTMLRCIEAAVKGYTPAAKPPARPGGAATVPSQEPAQQTEEPEEVPDVQTPGASFIPPYKEEEEPPRQEISALPLALRATAPPATDNFRITDDHPGEGGPKARFRANMEAIKVLNFIEADGRTATQEEQEVLSRYVGWGGIPEAFDPDRPDWAAEYRELKDLLSEAEYASAMSSTLNAHYTSPVIIRAIYAAVQAMGFTSGNILEPGCGIGNFFGCLPESMAASRLYGVELDSLSARIARQLYPRAHITAAGFETTDCRDFYDLAVGNVPFGQYQVNDPVYGKYGFSIHNYFLVKTLDQLRLGGILACITSRYTMDGKDPAARKYLSQRARLLGAVRLPNSAFKANAGTDVVSDILFLQKAESPVTEEPEWVQTVENEDGHPVNRYFLAHPEMVLGTPCSGSARYGMDYTVNPIPGADLGQQLRAALQNVHGEYRAAVSTELDDSEEDAIPADPNVKNYSYTIADGKIYYRENSVMVRPSLSAAARERVRGMILLRDCVRRLIDIQLDEHTTDSAIQSVQAELNRLYDAYTRKYGLINSCANRMAFDRDSSYYLLCSLEIVDENGRLQRKADMFTRRTIRPRRRVSHVDTASEALTVSIGERGRVDLPYMARLTGKDEDTLTAELHGVIFHDPDSGDWQTADEYLSGNVRRKLRSARAAAERDPAYQVNADALGEAQPRDLDASEIEVRLGATWIGAGYIREFMLETLRPPGCLRDRIDVCYFPQTATWMVAGKNDVSSNDIAACATYGTGRMNAYRILEDSLNLRDVRVYDTVEDPDGSTRRVLNGKETALAAQKQAALREAFRDWIWKDPARRQALTAHYNETMNCIRPREYDGSHIVFSGINPGIRLQPHQVNAIAHVLYGGNTLLAHEVGAGKTFEMIASAMESKRLGLCSKSIFVVPNHLTEQTAAEFLRLYPAANILVTTRKDFEPARRKKFCARIATGDYDAVIIGHSQFEKIPMSMERQSALIEQQISDITEGIAEIKRAGGERFSVKDLARTKKRLEARLEKLQANHRKDDVVTFEQLGVDMMFVDESDNYKNLFLYTKMRNVAGLSTADAQKSSDMFAKCRYLDELTGGRGVVFATGTPISNSMTEMYTIQRYLQYDRLEEMGMGQFDAWASRFGETVSALELAPEGTGYRLRTRFARFFNLPELMAMFKEVADIRTADQLNLPVPEVEYHNVVSKPTEHQKEMVKVLSKRAEKVHSGAVDAHEDNMLRITSDGRKLGLDQRIINPALPDDSDTKVNRCVSNVLRHWREGEAGRLTQLIFCDISTPTAAGFNIYDDLRKKLIAGGMPAGQVAFIHDADTDQKKKALFARVNAGQVRVLVGSTQKMGAGTNIQQRLIALHDLDAPWRPRDLIQRKGRIERRGNTNPLVHVYRYVTEGTFDAYLWQTIENKQKFISQIMTSKSPVRSCEDVDEAALSYAEIKALCTGDPRVKERMELDMDVARLRLLKAGHQSQQYRMQDDVLRRIPRQIRATQADMAGIRADMETLALHPHPAEGFAGMTVGGISYTEREGAGEAILAVCQDITGKEPVEIGSYRGFRLAAAFSGFGYVLHLRGSLSYKLELGESAGGNITRIDNGLEKLPVRLNESEARLASLHRQLEDTRAELGKPFPQEEELADKAARLAALDAELNIGRSRAA